VDIGSKIYMFSAITGRWSVADMAVDADCSATVVVTNWIQRRWCLISKAAPTAPARRPKRVVAGPNVALGLVGLSLVGSVTLPFDDRTPPVLIASCLRVFNRIVAAD
jgi:hypothetical protein